MTEKWMTDNRQWMDAVSLAYTNSSFIYGMNLFLFNFLNISDSVPPKNHLKFDCNLPCDLGDVMLRNC